MWKANTTIDSKISEHLQQTKDEDDWDTDPDFVNNVSEKDKRYGNQKTMAPDVLKTPTADVERLGDICGNVVNANNSRIVQEWKERDQTRKQSYGVDKAPKT
ncbi:uncharacterized protein BJ171DRAFT_580136 [Polychytrium aggregatum]|uniref:uncharacterized protein n=1 Tax=Polychytrium aggregatum TaxID=110093 RepID=UPI0022FDCE01|nr:uncharacterized protein BJ171DRAFT_580136 [Polychytrium aggregatum]KAI9206063.1 hypothetical protein BJ171DRAFT_580136 [Polychytrium aggregatum]